MPTYTLRAIPGDLWGRVKARATREEHQLRDVLLDALHRYADEVHAAGGRKAAAGMSAEARKARAVKAARARWK
jgi:hypothetical protein